MKLPAPAEGENPIPPETLIAQSNAPESEGAPEWRVGPYEIKGQIGQGGMATVYRAWHSNLHRFEALKIPRRENGVDSEYIPRLLAEARMAARLFHPHIVAIHNISEDGAEHPYFSMDLVEGQDLSLLLKARGSLPLQETSEIVRQTASGIAHAHQNNVVHRDIKPENILMQPLPGGQWHIKVVDFGISRAAQDLEGTRLTRSGMMVGTPEYMSPEQSGSGSAVDFRTDIYSLGIVAYELLTGAPPFSVGTDVSRMAILISHVRDLPRSPHEVNPEIPREVSDVIMKALAKNPAERFASAEDFAAALSAASKPATVVPIVGQGFRFQRSRGSWAALATAVAMGVLFGWLASTIPGRSIFATAADLPNHSVSQEKPKAALRAAAIDTRKLTLQRPIVFERKTQNSASLLKGQTKIIQKGANGLREVVLQIASREGKEVSRRPIGSRVLRAATPQIVMSGTGVKTIRKVKARRKIVPARPRVTRQPRRVLRASPSAPRRTATVTKRRAPRRSRPSTTVSTPRPKKVKQIRPRKIKNKKSPSSRSSGGASDQVLGSFRIPAPYSN